MKTLLNLLSVFYLAAWFLAISPAHSEEINKKSGILITSDQMISENEQNRVRFIGNVKVVYDDLILTSDELHVYSDNEKKAVEKIVALGNVLINKGERKLSSEKAVLYNDEKKIEITGNPTISEKGNMISGEKIIYFYAKEGIIVHGGSKKKATMYIASQKKVEKGIKGDK